MTRLTQAVAVVLILTGVITFIATGASSVTALIPAFVGILIGVCGVLAMREKFRRHAIHLALVFALIGALGSLMNVVKIGQLFNGTAERPGAIIESIILLVVTVLYLIFGIRSFIAARKARTGGE
ncbi:hypothetical protein [Microlunatus sp. GCM10028923]|uniref:hypothetical protein n=1 Tax=Microlunatus sp. GCM10028923 TaxID=3273400 RepID=UPI0036244268